MKHSIEVTFDTNKAAEILKEYFGFSLPDNILAYRVIAKDFDILSEVLNDTLSDTYAREKLIYAVVKILPDNTGKEWPCYGTPDDVAKEFYTWFADAITKIGGSVYWDQEP